MLFKNIIFFFSSNMFFCIFFFEEQKSVLKNTFKQPLFFNFFVILRKRWVWLTNDSHRFSYPKQLTYQEGWLWELENSGFGLHTIPIVFPTETNLARKKAVG